MTTLTKQDRTNIINSMKIAVNCFSEGVYNKKLNSYIETCKALKEYTKKEYNFSEISLTIGTLSLYMGLWAAKKDTLTDVNNQKGGELYIEEQIEHFSKAMIARGSKYIISAMSDPNIDESLGMLISRDEITNMLVVSKSFHTKTLAGNDVNDGVFSNIQKGMKDIVFGLEGLVESKILLEDPANSLEINQKKIKPFKI